MDLENETMKNLGGIHCIATYNNQVIPENQENPFIEAIPNRLSIEEFYDMLYSIPKYNSDHRNIDIEDRLALVRQIKPSFWLPTPSQYEKYRGIYNMIKIGYQSRNPINIVYNKQFAVGWDTILKEGLDDTGANIIGNIQTAQSLSEVGLSGMGKSKNYERILKKLFPQVIHHKEYKGKQLTLTQVVWLKIECPSGKSIRSLCQNFYDEVDKILGTNFYEKHGEKRGTIDNLTKRMAKIVAQINLGVLIIDEIQNIHKAHSGGDERMINFITELVNTLGVPVIVIGTFKAMYLFKNSLATSRRGVPDEFSENIVSFMQEDSWEWNEFISTLWELQYTSKYTPLTSELKKVMYYHTMGIPDIVIKLFMHVQARVILNGGDEQINEDIINKVASKTLVLLQHVFEKLRNGDQNVLNEIDDIEPEWASFNEYLKQASHEVKIRGEIAKKHARVIQQRNEDVILNDLVNFASNLVSNTGMAETLANQVFKASDGMGDIKAMFSQIAQLALNADETINKEESFQYSNKKRIKPILENGDVRLIVKNGLKRGLSTEEALEEFDLVRDCNELHKFTL
ncbi:ATP-binding protein [Gracilibacillus dipsosauri]|uniref:ORC1/DEAH AAA+ ATPase domain-containing protein n=1 Tax=Gracilibacillus dipsosauri TaxID=178340 RepID=A0A317L3I4_9BACI|nr:ATP-binding protein [Gracilibacillus dipsosauri]PWU70441.1 hypothetical protein DLJ74_01000 [Gracilibacillus dipsosauri]